MNEIRGDGAGSSLLVVDDTPENLELLSDMLKRKGYRVRSAPSGKLALQAARNDPPDLVLLDITMPGMDGFQVCEEMKSDPVLREIPVIFISALAESMDKVKAFSMGGVDYVTKPFQIEEVHARVDTHVKIHLLQVELERHNKNLEELVQAQVKEISASQMATIFALARLAESRDDDTGKHLERVQALCREVAINLKGNPVYATVVTDSFIESIFHASPLHDIGKVAIPDAILLKPGRLTPEEFEIMKTHAARGAETLDAVQRQYPKNYFVNMGIEIALYHHEKWNGAGYPDGLKGTAIPLSARIMAVADVYDALRAKRCYKEAFSHEQSCGIILKGRGTDFDPDVVDAFMKINENKVM
jgi:putative two-component system response regulator